MSIIINHLLVQAQHQAAFESVLNRFLPMEIFAIIGYGSYFTGHYSDNSDIDIFVITRSMVYERTQFYENGLRFEITHVGGKRFMGMLKKGNAAAINGVVRGAVLFEKADFAQKIVHTAQQIHSEGPPEFKAPDMATQIRSRVGTIYEDLQDARDISISRIIAVQLVNACFNAVCFQHSLWKLGSKYLLEQTHQVEPKVAQLMQAMLSSDSISHTLNHAHALVQYTLSPLGGPLAPQETVNFA